MVSSILGSHPAPHSSKQALTFEGELDPGGGEAVVLGVGSPPAQSQQGGPEEDTDHGHGGHAPGRRDPGGSGGAEPAEEGTRGRDVSSRHPPPPDGDEPHIPLSIARRHAASPGRSGRQPREAEFCSAARGMGGTNGGVTASPPWVPSQARRARQAR